jgi:hypothetical protein
LNWLVEIMCAAQSRTAHPRLVDGYRAGLGRRLEAGRAIDA